MPCRCGTRRGGPGRAWGDLRSGRRAVGRPSLLRPRSARRRDQRPGARV